MNIVHLGHCSFNVIASLTDAVKENLNDVKISVVDIIHPGGSITKEELKRFDEVLNLPSRKNVKYNFKDKYSTILGLLKDNIKRRILIKSLILFRLNSLWKYIDYETEEKIYSQVLVNFFEKYNIFHFHYVVPGFIRPLKYINKNKKIILSIWGSDLFETSGIENYEEQLKAFERADIVAVNTLEKREIFLSKFGRHLTSKTRLAFFGMPECKFDKLESKKCQRTILNFKNEHGISSDKRIITLGYNGSSSQRHIEILKKLDSLEPHVKKKFHVVIPMTYGLQFEEKDYLQKVKCICENVSFSSTIFNEYLSEESMTNFTISSEIKLNLRETDSMNAAMIESLFAGNIVVNGAWLPYSKLKRLGVYYKEIENIDELKRIIPAILENYECEKERAKENSKLVKDFFISRNTVKDWIKIYNELNE